VTRWTPPENTREHHAEGRNVNTRRWTADGSRISQLNIMTATALRILPPALLCVCVNQPVQAQGFLKKLQAKTRAIAETVQQTGEKADTALSKAGQTAAAIKCLASDTTCVGQANAQGQPQVGGASSGTQLPSPAGSATLPPPADADYAPGPTPVAHSGE
jgi:hypothetical protein